jgi:hypothetical protein
LIHRCCLINYSDNSYSSISGVPKEDHEWFFIARQNIIILEHFYFNLQLPTSFLISAFVESKKPFEICESPHPYPPGVKVSSKIYIPGANFLIVLFDARSIIGTIMNKSRK